MHRPLLAILLSATLAPTFGCVAFNDPCQPLVENPDALDGYVGEEVYLDKDYARHDNNALGQLAADAFRHAEDDSSTPADLGIINSGSIRAEGLCVTRTAVHKGPLKDGLLHEIFLFENQVVTLDVTEQQLVDMMEHSVAALYQEGQVITSPSGALLQLSGGTSLTVDCSKPKGQRVRALTVNGRTVSIPARTDTSIRYRVAMPSFLAEGGDGYGATLGTAVKDASRNPVTSRKNGGTDSNITAAYMRGVYPSETQALKEEPRIVFQNCAKAVRPTK